MSGIRGHLTSLQHISDEDVSDVLNGRNPHDRRIAAEDENNKFRWHAIIQDGDASHEDKMWSRIFCNRNNIPWPETVDLEEASPALLDENGDQWRADKRKAIRDVAAFMEAQGLEK